jgi:NAD(P)H dehydrogenase (quinone)
MWMRLDNSDRNTNKTKQRRAIMILVTGATGQLGTAVVNHLLKKTSANQVTALVRDESKASALKEKGVNIRVGNYNDSASLDNVMQGIETVLLIAGTDEENRLRQHQNVVDAAKKAGVQCIAYTSRNLKDPNTLVNKLMKGHFQTEDCIKASGLSYVLFRNVLYMDTIPQFVGAKVFDTGINLPTDLGRVAFTLRSEMGEAIANVLLESDRSNRIYQLTGSESYSFEDVAAILTNLSGKKVNYTSVEKSVFEAQMIERGVPEFMVVRVVGFLTDIKNGQESEVSPDLANLLGRSPASLQEGLKVLFDL